MPGRVEHLYLDVSDVEAVAILQQHGIDRASESVLPVLPTLIGQERPRAGTLSDLT